MKIDQKFVDQTAAYTPHPDGWYVDIWRATRQLQSLRDQLAAYIEATNDITSMYSSDICRNMLAGLAGSVVYGYKELNLGNISMTKGQLITR